MKKIYIVLFGIITLLSCSKEINTPETIQGDNTIDNPVTYELFATISDVTKAEIDESTGAFTWDTWDVGDSGDEIAVKTNTGKVYKFKAAEINEKGVARFVYTGTAAIDGTPTSAVYPYTEDATCSLPTALNGLTAALGDGIRLTGKIAEGKSITFSHANALLKVNFNYVPTKAKKISFDGNVNDVVVSGISLTSLGSVSAYIPVDTTTTSFTVSILDSSDNLIFEKKSSTGKSFTAGTLKTLKSVDLPTDVYTIVGDNTTVFGSSWDLNNTNNEMGLQADNTYKKVYTISSAQVINFKIVKNHNYDNGSWPDENRHLNFTTSGTLTIYFNPANGDITVNTDYDLVYTVAGNSIDIFGGDNAWDLLEANDMVLQSDGKYLKSYTVSSAVTIEFKVVKYRSTWMPDENIAYSIPCPGTFYVCVDPSSDAISKWTEANSYEIPGSFNNWNTSASMTKQTDGTYTYTAEIGTAGLCKYKIIANGSWNYQVYTNNGEDVEYNVTSPCNLTFTYDPKTSAVTINETPITSN